MTVIAYRQGVLATDSLVSGNITLGTFIKGRSKNGWLTGVSGPVAEAQQYLDWFDEQKFKRQDRILFEQLPPGIEYGALLVSPNDEFFIIESGSYFPFKPLDEYAAEGSGAQIALGVMFHGGSAEDAVRAAIRYVPNCGGDIQVYKRD